MIQPVTSARPPATFAAPGEAVREPPATKSTKISARPQHLTVPPATGRLRCDARRSPTGTRWVLVPGGVKRSCAPTGSRRPGFFLGFMPNAMHGVRPSARVAAHAGALLGPASAHRDDAACAATREHGQPGLAVLAAQHLHVHEAAPADWNQPDDDTNATTGGAASGA